MTDRYEHIEFSVFQHNLHLKFRSLFKTIEKELDHIAPGRARSIVLTKIEEAYMWVGKAIRDEQREKYNKNCEEYDAVIMNDAIPLSDSVGLGDK